MSAFHYLHLAVCSILAPMAVSGHEERFPPTRLNAGYVLRKETIAGVRLDGQDAPIPNLPPLAPERGGSTHGERSLGLLRSRNPTFAGFSPPAHPTTLISQA